MVETLIALTSALLGILLSNGFAVLIAHKQRKQRTLDLVIALHAEIDAGVRTIGRQLTEDEIRYAMRNSNPFATPDNTDTIYNSVKDDLSILPIEVIHEVVRYYRLASQTNLMTADLRDPMFARQKQSERQKFVGSLVRLGNEQFAAGIAALAALEHFAEAAEPSLNGKRSAPRDVEPVQEISAKAEIKQLALSVRSRQKSPRKKPVP
jgi:DNA-binding transcriptional LysR family regulator